MEKLRQCQKLFFEAQYVTLLKVAFRYVSTYEQAVEMTYEAFSEIINEVTRLKIGQDLQFKDGFYASVKRIFIVILVDKIRSAPDLHIPQPVPEDLWQASGDLANSESDMLHIEVIKILKQLPVTPRLVFNLHVIDGFSHAEIANLLHITVKESKNNLLEARKYCYGSLESIKLGSQE
jgi:RNA polymerase sigma factor (sigma-70 family)